jgi:aspartate-semialdehyde dehydrogenase
MKKIKVALLGCTGLVGREFIRLLDDHPYFELSCLTASSRSANKTCAEALVIRETTAAEIIRSGARAVFSALPAAAAGPLEAELRAAGLRVFSNAGAHRLDGNVPLLIPEVNPGHLELARQQLRTHPGFIVTNPNCVVAGLALVLKPLTALGLRTVTVTTFQAVSGGGRRGVAAWDILGNVVPFIAGEEEKIVRETGKILGELAGGHVADSPIEIYPSCSRVPVREGHLQSVSAEFVRPVGGEEIKEALSGFAAEPQQLKLPTAPAQPIVVRGEEDRPQPSLDVQAGEPDPVVAGRHGRARGMAVSVGRLRPRGSRCDFFLLLHNTVRGAAGGSVLNAELAVRKGWIPEAAND